MNEEKKLEKFKNEWHDSDANYKKFREGLSLQKKIQFYLKIDPEFAYEFEELNSKLELEEITPKERREEILVSVAEADYRRIQFMSEAMKKKFSNDKTKKTRSIMLKEYSKLVSEREESLDSLRKRVRARRQEKLEADPDYKKMIKVFGKIKERKKELKKSN